MKARCRKRGAEAWAGLIALTLTALTAFPATHAASLDRRLMKILHGHGWAFRSDGGCAKASSLTHSEVVENGPEVKVAFWNMNRELRIDTDKDGHQVGSVYRMVRIEGDKIFMVNQREERARAIIRVIDENELWLVAADEDGESKSWEVQERCCKNGKRLEKCE